MEVMEAIRTRRSVRAFRDDAVEPEKLQTVLEAARLAPSWANMQCWRFVVVRDPAARTRLSELSYVADYFAAHMFRKNPAQKALAQAPVVIVACADPARSGSVRGADYYLADVGIAAGYLMLAARSVGLGSVFVGVFDEEKVRALLGIPPDIRIVGLLPLGYPQDPAKAGPPRKAFEEIVFDGAWKR